MKKYIIGVLLGILISTTVSVTAREFSSTLFNVTLYINGEEKKLPEQYKVINYNGHGHAYVPIRFVTENLNGKVEYKNKEKSIIISSSSFINLPAKYTKDIAIKNGDIVFDFNYPIPNFSKFKNFINNTEKGVPDWIRITRYSDEGKPILQELNFNGDKIEYLYLQKDTRNYEARASICENINKRLSDQENSYDYVLSNCSGDTEREIILLKSKEK